VPRPASTSLYDRQVYMQTDGRIAYASGTGAGARTLVSPSPLNNGGWHHVVVTARPHGSQQDASLYVDGADVASGTINHSSSFSGWWRAGYGALPTTSGYPTNATFAGAIDELAIYPSELTAARIAAHYAAR